MGRHSEADLDLPGHVRHVAREEAEDGDRLDKNGSFGAGDQTITLASNVVNTAASVNRPIFTYVLGNSGTYATTTSLNAGNASAVVAVNIEIDIDTTCSPSRRTST